MKNAKSVFVLVLVALGVTGLLYGYDHYTKVETDSQPFRTTTSQAPLNAKSPTQPLVDLDPQSDLVKQLAIQYLERYGESIHHPGTQAKLYNEWQELLRDYPEQGQWLFEAAIALAFPEYRNAILSLMERLALYHQWLDDNYLSLQRMDILESRAAIWQKREELFGSDAELIWADEQTALNQQQEAIHVELRRLDQAHHLSPAEAASQLQNAVDEIYREGFARQLITPDVVATALFSLDSVQAQLQALPEEEQQAQLNALRKQLGMPDDVIARLEEQDQQRNARWKQGYQYMAEREELARQFSGEQLNRELEALREKHFGRAAKTIAQEEAEGFYRFNRPRRLGLN